MKFSTIDLLSRSLFTTVTVIYKLQFTTHSYGDLHKTIIWFALFVIVYLTFIDT